MNITSKSLLIALVTLGLSACSSTEYIDSKSTEEPVTSEIVVEEKMEPVETTPVEKFTEEELMVQQYGAAILKTTIRFDFDKSNIKPEFTPVLLAHAAYLASHPEKKLTIEGNADDKGTPEYNILLGERRAKAVETYLKNNGVAANQISVVSYGEEKPVNNDTDESARAENRRAVVVY